MILRIDLRSRILSKDHKSHMIRSGKEYHLFGQVIEHSAVAPDLPELAIPNGQAPIYTDDFENQIKRSRALRDWAMLPAERSEPKPSIAVEDYQDKPIRQKHGLYANSAQDVLWTIPTGSLIYVPNPGFLNDGLFGEIVARKLLGFVFGAVSYQRP